MSHSFISKYTNSKEKEEITKMVRNYKYPVKNIETVAIIGAGILGSCAAMELSLCGVKVILHDPNEDTLASFSEKVYEILQPLWRLGYIPRDVINSSIQKVGKTPRLEDCAKADLVIEAIPENMQAKRNVFNKLEELCDSTTIIASSTISLSVDSLGELMKYPKRFLGVRLFYPCVLVAPVELTPASFTSTEVVDDIYAFLVQIGKKPHRGPTRRILSKHEIMAFQTSRAVQLGYMNPDSFQANSSTLVVPRIIPAVGPPLGTNSTSIISGMYRTNDKSAVATPSNKDDGK